MTAPQIWIKNQATEQWLEAVFRAWLHKFPERARIYFEMLVDQKANLVNPSGKSRGGTIAYRGMIPQELFLLIDRKYPGFFRDPQNMALALRVFMGEHRPEVKRSKDFVIIDRRKDA